MKSCLRHQADTVTGSLGMVIHAGPDTASFRHALRTLDEALSKGDTVYLYLLDEGVSGLHDVELTRLIAQGARVSACAYAMEARGMDCPEAVTAAGLTMMSDILLYSDHTLVFN